MDPLDVLEKRIEALELQILPKKKQDTSDNKSQAVTDLLIQTQTMISSALSCREAITSILQHMSTINEYLDPTNGESELEVEAKRSYLLELYPELIETVKLISTFEKITPYADSKNISRINDLSSKLEQLSVFNLNILEESRDVTGKIINSLQQYNDITTSIKVLFSQLDRAITDLEIALVPKFDTEE